MPLVTPLHPDTDQHVQTLATFFNETLGFCPNSVLTMQIRPRIATAFIELNKAVMENKGRVSSELKRLIGYLTSHVAGCQYCKAHTILAAQRYGGTKDRLQSIWEYKTSELFTEAEKAAFDFAIASSTIPNSMNQEIEHNLKAHWNDGEIVEILGVISLFGFLNRWNDTMATSLETGAESAAQDYLNPSHWQKGKHQ